MRPRSSVTAEQQVLLAAFAGGLAALIGGVIFIGALLAMDLNGLRTLAAADGWVTSLVMMTSFVIGLSALGFALGPVVAALSGSADR